MEPLPTSDLPVHDEWDEWGGNCVMCGVRIERSHMTTSSTCYECKE